ncbi:uncharacterized protein LOC118477622 [Aplysia californica]|uniref:Uncharacterized protein LOC118477622 n=1 Tax=Aplysia californica TaxID=6500 RepID=A0ABM1VSS1_APLCA|nr:uncharacterized protein LOC118477622 [Aplysia californica]
MCCPSCRQQEQVLEMREWFRAFKEQDHSVRDYRKYFKPNLCYLEAGWTLSSRDTLQEPFASDRHHLEASSWFDLSEKIRYTSYTGHMNALENFAYLPTTLYNVTEDGTPQIAQWNYRMLCHPLSRDLPTKLFRLQDDLPYRMAHDRSMDKMPGFRSARFKLSEFEEPRPIRYTLLDELMAEIPGKDNYGANLTDDSFGLPNFDVGAGGQRPLNVGYYHRLYMIGQRGAMGGQVSSVRK